jgi:DinB superfamily
MTQDNSAAELAKGIDDARQRLISFVQGCSDEAWRAAPVDGDLRSVGVVADHVGHAYEYLARWIGDLIAGKPVEVTTEIVDELNAEHASTAGDVSPADVTRHLHSSGDTLISLVASLDPEQLELGDGLVRRFAVIAARHADSHRAELEQTQSAAG